jgi:hypothetical protein
MKTEHKNLLYMALAAAATAGIGYGIYKHKDKIAAMLPAPASNPGIVPPLIASSPPLIPSTPAPPLIPTIQAPPLIQSPPVPPVSTPKVVVPPVTIVTPPANTGVKDAQGNTFLISDIKFDTNRNWILVNGVKNGAGINLRVVNGVAQINNGLPGDTSVYLFQGGKWIKQVTPTTSLLKTTNTVLTKPALVSGLGSLSAMLR